MKYAFVIALFIYWPAVSNNIILKFRFITSFLLISTFWKLIIIFDIPIVEVDFSSNLFPDNLEKIADFRTRESPNKIILYSIGLQTI